MVVMHLKVRLTWFDGTPRFFCLLNSFFAGLMLKLAISLYVKIISRVLVTSYCLYLVIDSGISLILYLISRDGRVRSPSLFSKVRSRRERGRVRWRKVTWLHMAAGVQSSTIEYTRRRCRVRKKFRRFVPLYFDDVFISPPEWPGKGTRSGCCFFHTSFSSYWINPCWGKWGFNLMEIARI